MKDYHDLSLNVDVLLLGCLFEHFTEKSINSFESDLVHYYLLRFTDANLKLISDVEKYQFIEITKVFL